MFKKIIVYGMVIVMSIALCIGIMDVTASIARANYAPRSIEEIAVENYMSEEFDEDYTYEIYESDGDWVCFFVYDETGDSICVVGLNPFFYCA